MTAEAERQAIKDLWPAHIEHLPPETNRLGQPWTDTEHGIVCNCGDVLGWPKDAAKAQQEAGVVEAEVVEHRYDAAMDPSAMAGADNPAVYLRYDGPPRPGNGEIYTDPSGVQWDSTAEQPHPDDPRFKYYAQEAPEEYGDDSADEAQATLGGRPVRDVQLPPGTALEPASSEDTWPPRDSGGPEDPPDFAGKLPTRPTDVMIPADPLDARVTVIDPSLPYGPEQVEHQLIRIEGQIERGIHFQRHWEERLHYAKVAFELANARALIKADGGDAATRKAQALLACETEYVELQVCETMVRSVRECMHNLRSLQTGYQTISNSVGAAYRSRPSGA